MLLPFALASLVAQGVMPAKAGDGTVSLIICTGDSFVEMAFDPVTMEPVSENKRRDERGNAPSHCAWAAAHPVCAEPAAMEMKAPVSQTLTVLSPPCRTVLRVAAATGLPPSTGPPSSV
ncbi:hypothetical protein [Rhodovulum sulfidophilum]|nr:hypothetical protein [Rhodovulum sulfidophilum]